METNYFRSFDGTRLYYEQFGDGEPPIVLIHGWTGSHGLWERTAHDLAPRFKVVTMDNRGHGDSEKPI
jgi:pimeloyl-ACP methyl ester carboxylesterase